MSLIVLCLGLGGALPALAQEDLEGVFGDMGSTAVEDDEAALAQQRKAGEGSIAGRVFDGSSGVPIEGAAVILVWPAPSDGSEPPQAVAQTDFDGGYAFPSVPPGRYTMTFVKSGYRSSTMTKFEVVAGQTNRADFPLPLAASTGSESVMQLDAFVVEASTVGDMMNTLELRLESDSLANILSEEDFSKYAAGDVADALKRVAGVNIVEGQFAVIRGLDDRYTATTFNGAPVPSPDPDRQSVQLDLFPTEVVNNLKVEKTFLASLPSNASGGAINILTDSFPEDFVFEVKSKGKIEEGAFDEFLDVRSSSPISTSSDGFETLAAEFGGLLGGRYELFDREIRFRGVANWQTDYETGEGFQHSRQPRRANVGREGGLTTGDLGLSAGRFDLTDSSYEEQLTGFGALGIDLDSAGNHQITATYFYTEKLADRARLEENGYLPGFGYNDPGGPVERTLDGLDVRSDDFLTESGVGATPGARVIESLRGSDERPDRGPLWFSSFGESSTFENERDLTVYQLNGRHAIDRIPGLTASWAGNFAVTNQDDRARSMQWWYEPCGYQNLAVVFGCSDGADPIPVPTVFPTTVSSLGEGQFFSWDIDLLESVTAVEEEQWFGRFDTSYERGLTEWLAFEMDGGVWYETSKRNVDSNFLQSDGATGAGTAERCNQGRDLIRCLGATTDPVTFAPDLLTLGEQVWGDIAFARQDEADLFEGSFDTSSKAEREILGFALGGKATIWSDIDILAGLRIEDITIISENDPFIDGFEVDRAPRIFPSKFLFFDRFGDNPVRETFRTPGPFNDELIGFPVSLGPCRGTNVAGEPPDPEPVIPGECVDLTTREEILDAANGEIDELRFLPMVGFTYRVLPSVTLRGAYSQTVARPSLREIGYYLTVDQGTDDRVVGNPQMELSDVESFDLRVEYVDDGNGDVFALSGFFKTIEKPIESIILNDPSTFTGNADFRTFFNNPNDATLWGIEVEARKVLDVLPSGWWGSEFLSYFSIGGNFTYIDAEVERTDAELARANQFYFEGSYPRKRRLFGQPEWTANADISFSHPDWGSEATLSFFAISDVLDAAGEQALEGDLEGTVEALTVDRYVAGFHTLDLVLKQALWGGFSIKANLKNLTDSERKLIYDTEVTNREFRERSLRFGREYSVELKYTLELPLQ